LRSPIPTCRIILVVSAASPGIFSARRLCRHRHRSGFRAHQAINREKRELGVENRRFWSQSRLQRPTKHPNYSALRAEIRGFPVIRPNRDLNRDIRDSIRPDQGCFRAEQV
jgi:hypothetical protein